MESDLDRDSGPAESLHVQSAVEGSTAARQQSVKYEGFLDTLIRNRDISTNEKPGKHSLQSPDRNTPKSLTAHMLWWVYQIGEQTEFLDPRTM